MTEQPTAPRMLYQCPGCWSFSEWPNDGSTYECECGERLTRIDLRAPEPSPFPEAAASVLAPEQEEAVRRTVDERTGFWDRIASGRVSLVDATGTTDVADGVRILAGWARDDVRLTARAALATPPPDLAPEQEEAVRLAVEGMEQLLWGYDWLGTGTSQRLANEERREAWDQWTTIRHALGMDDPEERP